MFTKKEAAKAHNILQKMEDFADIDLLGKIEAVIERNTPTFVRSKGWNGYSATRYYCPNCNKSVRRDSGACDRCGQLLKYPKLVRKDNKLVFDWTEGDDE